MEIIKHEKQYEGIVSGPINEEFFPWSVKSIEVEFKDPSTGKKISGELDIPSPDWEAESLAKSADSEVTMFENTDITISVTVTQSYGDIYLDDKVEDLKITIHEYLDVDNDNTYQDYDDVDDMFDPIQPDSPNEYEQTDKHEVDNYNIDSYTNAIPIERLVSDFDNNIYAIPPFQRKFVWDQRQIQGIDRPSLFIDSILLGLPITPIILYRERNDRDNGILIDGLQRLSTLSSYISGEFPSGKPFKLKGNNLKCNTRYHNKLFSELNEDDQINFKRSFLAVTFIRQLSPEENSSASSMHLLFQRLNTGGLTLTPHEVRSVLALKNEPLLEVLKKLYDMKWNEVFGMKDNEKVNLLQEYIFRAYVFAKSYKQYKRPLQGFLDENMLELTPSDDDVHIVNEIRELFISTKKEQSNLFCPPSKATSKGKHHVALFDAIFVATYAIYKKDKTLTQKQFMDLYEQYLKLELYKSKSGRGSVDVFEVKNRISEAIKIFDPS